MPRPRVGILGVGAVGARAARQLVATDPDLDVVLSDVDRARASAIAESLGQHATAVAERDLFGEELSALVVAAPSGCHGDAVARAVAAKTPCISTSDRIEDVQALFGLEADARKSSVSVLAGVGFSPGMSCVLAAVARDRFDVVDEVHVAREGTGGPACARQHHRALSSSALDWRDGGWVRRPGGSGRELVWFPEPVGGSDCYRAALPDALLLHGAFPDSSRVTARMAATRQDRLTSWLPMLSPPHPEGGVGAVRVELRGRLEGRRVVHVLGAVAQPAVAAGAVVASAVEAVLQGWGPGPGVLGLAEGVDAKRFLRSLAARGLRAQEFAGFTAG